jgi:aminopeptidase N
MPKLLSLFSLGPLLLALVAAATEHPALVGHRLDVRIDPAQGTIAAQDLLDLPAGAGSWDFFLHPGLDPQVVAGHAKLARLGARGHREHFRLVPEGSAPVTLGYWGRIHHPLEELREGMGRARQGSPGIISDEGVVLDGFSGWYPQDPSGLQHFDLRVRLPKGWMAVSQGAGPEVSSLDEDVSVRWREAQPQESIYLIAAPFERYTKATPHGEAQVYLRSADPQLAEGYLEATGRYLSLYSRLIGPYPYAKFALVENFWDTGFGMPSFTLLGPRVIRLPFILHTSFPHEVLHNWWGNGVYVDYDTGNWSEGLTAYLADHLLAEQGGRGAEYRRDSLRAYADYVRAANDFPLHDFRGPHGSASQAIGYGKALMVLHMLRRNLGDETFVAALRRFYRENLFQRAGFDDLRRAMEQESGRALEAFFRRWIKRTGAPELALSNVRVDRTSSGRILHGRLEQVQSADPFPLQVPLVVHLTGGGILERQVALKGRSADFELPLPAAPIRVDVDPRFDLFRTLAPGESPATLSALFGSESGLILLPADAPADLAEGYRRLAEAWREGSPGWVIQMDSDRKSLPRDRPLWLLGWSNRFLADLISDQSQFQLDAARRSLHLPQGDYAGKDFSLALVRDHGGQSVGWIGSPDPSALPGLARKLPHYGKYSYLVFQGGAPEIRVKGRWPVQDSTLMVWLSDRRSELAIPPHRPLTGVSY